MPNSSEESQHQQQQHQQHRHPDDHQHQQHQHQHQDHHYHNHHRSKISRTSSLLLTLLFLSSLLAPSSPASLPVFMTGEKPKHPLSRQSENGECDTNMEVSAICYHCASLNTVDFQEVHMQCCVNPGRVREICAAWYTTDPKRGGSNTWYY